MSDKKLEGMVGSPVYGDRFWGREADLSLLIKKLKSGAHVSIIAQRRIGKTSLMHEASRNLSEDFVCLHVDLQDVSDPGYFITKLSIEVSKHKPLWKKAAGIFSNALGAIRDNIDEIGMAEFKIKLRADMTGETWKSKGEQLLSVLAAHDQPVILFIDELPIMISNMLRDPDSKKAKAIINVADLMSWIRAMSIEHEKSISIVLAGSIGLEPVLGFVGLSATLNTFTPFHIEPWDKPTAKGCLKALANNCENFTLTDDAAQAMLDHLGCCIPHHVQLFFDQAYSYCVRAGLETCSVEDIQEVYTKKMLRSHGNTGLKHMEERLKLVLPENQYIAAMNILTEAAREGNISVAQAVEMCEREESLEQTHIAARGILELLEHDGYLEKSDGGYAFISNLFKDWWKTRYYKIDTGA